MTNKIETVGATEARVILADILDQVRFQKAPVALTRHGKTVAYIVPAGDSEEFQSALASLVAIA